MIQNGSTTALGNPTPASRGRLERLAATAFGIGLGLPITPMELAGIPLMLVFLARTPASWRSIVDLRREPFAIALLVWIIWAAIAISWSPSPTHGLDELANARWIWVPLALTVAPHLANKVLVGIAIGFVCMHGSQLAQLVGQSLEVEALTFNHLPDRVSGWSMPAVAGSLLCAVLGLHLPRAIFAADWTKRLLAAAALVGLIATGTRGAWIVAALLLAMSILTLAILSVRNTGYRTRAIVLSMASLIVVITAGVALREKIASRVDEASREISAALNEGNKHTSTGGRIVMLEWAGKAITAHPAVGVGTGGYRTWVNQQQIEQGIAPESQRVLDHAHNAYLHIAATQGLIGLALFIAMATCALRNAWPKRPEDAGVFVGIAGLLLISMFDTIPVNAQTSALGMTLAAVAMANRRTARAALTQDPDPESAPA